VNGIPPLGGHVSRTLVFDAQGRLYVNVGTSGDVDQLAGDEGLRGMVRRFVLPASLPPGGIAYASGEIYASGLRNEVGLAFDSSGRMWGVENGSDGIDDDNPGEEINRLDGPGSRFFGHPYCWSELARDGGLGPGTQWAYHGYAVEQTDAWCRDPRNVHPPAGVMQGHWAALGIAEYSGGSLPWKGDLFITAHGSSFRQPPVGRLLARAHLVGDVVQSVTPIVGHAVDGGLEQGTWGVRPVDVRTGPDGALYFSDDFGHRVFRLGYRP
jgi:glucose/arabinose dehydrogenase